MYDELRRGPPSDEGQDGGGRPYPGGNALQSPVLWYISIMGSIMGFLLCLVHLYHYGFTIGDEFYVGRIGILFLTFSPISMMMLIEKAQDRREEQLKTIMAPTENPGTTAPTEPEHKPEVWRKKPKKTKRKHKTRR